MKLDGRVKVEVGFRRRMNNEIEALLKKDIAQIVGMQKDRWLEHFPRITDDGWVQEILMEKDFRREEDEPYQAVFRFSATYA